MQSGGDAFPVLEGAMFGNLHEPYYVIASSSMGFGCEGWRGGEGVS